VVVPTDKDLPSVDHEVQALLIGERSAASLQFPGRSVMLASQEGL